MAAPCTFATMEADDDGNVVEEVVIVSTDIEAPTATAFATVRSTQLDANLNELDVHTDMATPTPPTVTNDRSHGQSRTMRRMFVRWSCRFRSLPAPRLS